MLFLPRLEGNDCRSIADSALGGFANDKTRQASGTPAHDNRFVSVLRESAMGIIWTIIIGFIAGVIAKFITPGDNEPSGFILTTILGIIGAVVATYLGQAVGWYQAGEGAGLIGAIVGAVIILVIWGMIAGRRRSSV
jgi:uncharacterized membrane protein YeaQ/YmgE (transglycosylase-associated protein family)